MSTASAWSALRTSAERFDSQAWHSLLAGEYSSVVIDDFLTPAECAAVVRAIERRGLWKTLHGRNVESTHSGISATDYKDLSEPAYLKDVPLATEERKALLAELPDPQDLAFETLASVWPHGATLAAAAAEGQYFSGAIRRLAKSTTHNDWTPRDLPDWTIGRIARSLSWHLYLSAPEAGGEFHVWQRPWQPGDERYQLSDPALGYEESFLSSFPVAIEGCRTGRFVVFDTRNYHAFRSPTGDSPCYVISSFLAVVDDGRPMIFWS